MADGLKSFAFSPLFLSQIHLTWITTSVLVCPGKVCLFSCFFFFLICLLLSCCPCPALFISFQTAFLIFSHLPFHPTVTNFIMKAFINGRTVFGTPVRAFPPVYPSQMVSIHSHMNIFGWKRKTLTVLFSSICCRSTSLTQRCSLRGKWLLTTVAAASVARSATSWKTAPCVKSGWNNNDNVLSVSCVDLHI